MSRNRQFFQFIYKHLKERNKTMEMNKRAYVKPETEVVEMKYEGMLCNSGGGEGNHAPEMDDPQF
jgi:hypothetical protein